MNKLLAFALLAALAAFPAFAATAISWDTTDRGLIAARLAEIEADSSLKGTWVHGDALTIAAMAGRTPASYAELLRLLRSQYPEWTEQAVHRQARNIIRCARARFAACWADCRAEMLEDRYPDVVDLCFATRAQNGGDAEMAWHIVSTRVDLPDTFDWDWAPAVVNDIVACLPSYAAALGKGDSEVTAILRKLNRKYSMLMVGGRERWEPVVVRIRTLLEAYAL